MENFEKALDFIATDGSGRVGLIGGEPLIHDKFKDIIEKLIYDNRFERIVIYTNGLLIDKYINQLISGFGFTGSDVLVGRTAFDRSAFTSHGYYFVFIERPN